MLSDLCSPRQIRLFEFNIRYRVNETYTYATTPWATWKYNVALKEGVIKRPNGCSRCGKLCIPHGHHEDYERPLHIIWLCHKCHRQRHGEIRKTAQLMFAELFLHNRCCDSYLSYIPNGRQLCKLKNGRDLSHDEVYTILDELFSWKVKDAEKAILFVKEYPVFRPLLS